MQLVESGVVKSVEIMLEMCMHSEHVGKQSHFLLPFSGFFQQHLAYYIRQKSSAAFPT